MIYYLPSAFSGVNLSRAFSGVRDGFLLPIATTVQNKTQACSQLAAKTINVSKRVLTGKVTVYGFNVNIAAKGTALASTLLKKAHIIAPCQSEIPDSQLRAEMSQVRQEIDDKFQIISDSIAHSVDEEQTKVKEEDSRIESSEILALKETESQSKKLLIKHILNFSSITWFDKKIYGETRDDAIEFYRQLVNQNSSDPLDAYYEILWKQSPFYYSLASVFIPIANWFIGLFINPSLGNLGGINNAKGIISNYLKDPEKKRNEILELFKISKDYFYKLFNIYQTFAAIRKDPHHADYSLTLQEYLDKKLQEDITTLDRDPKELSKRFNTQLVNLFSPKSGIRVIGSLIDPILKMILSFAVNSIDPINKLLSSSFASSHSSLTFNYKVAALVEQQVRLFHDELIASQENQTLLSSKDEVHTCPTPNQAFISEEEQVLIEDFVSNLLKFLPLQGLEENQIEEELLPKQSPSFYNIPGKLAKKVHDVAEDSIKKSLQLFGVDLFGILTSKSLDNTKKIKIWTDVLNLGVGFFSEPGVARTSTDLIAIRQQARIAFKDLLNTALEFRFRKSSFKQSLDSNKLKTESIIRGIKYNSNQFKEKINILQEQLENAIAIKDIALLRKCNIDLLIEVKDFFTNSQLTTEESLSFPGIDEDAKKEIKIASLKITKEVKKLLDIHAHMEDIIHGILNNLPIHQAALNLLSESEPSEESTITILPSKTYTFLNEKLGFIHSKQNEFSDDGYKINLEDIASSYAEMLAILELNGKINYKDQLTTLFSQSQKLILENLQLKQVISYLPKQDEISSLEEIIKNLHTFIMDIAKKSEVDSDYLLGIAACFSHLKTALYQRNVDDESLDELDLFLRDPDLSEIKKNLSPINAAIHNLRTKLLKCPKIDAQALTDLIKNNKKLKELQNHLASLEITCSLQSPIDSIEMEESNLHLLNNLAEENNISLNLDSDQKIWHQNKLRALFAKINGQKQGQIDKTWNKASLAMKDLRPCFEAIYESDEKIKVKEALLETHPFDKKIADFQKSTAKPIFEAITNKLLDVVLVPRHREQLLFRSLLASNGPFSRIMPS